MTWQPLNLASSQYAVPPNPPDEDLHGLLYRGKRHVVSGEPESVKTLIVWALALDAIRAGMSIACLDFEMGPEATRTLLVDLGATDAELERVLYIEPGGPPTKHDILMIKSVATDIVIIDAAIGAYDVSGLDDMNRKDAERFARLWVRPLFQCGIATVVLDHVTKASEGRGKYTIGSERKVGGVDVHLGFEIITQLTRGTSGLVKVRVHKDRPGFLHRPHPAEIALSSDPDTHAITWDIRAATETTSGWQPTVIMGKVSTFLEQQTDPVSRNNVERSLGGTAQWVRRAMDELIQAGHVRVIPKGQARLLELVTPYTASDRVGPRRHRVADAVTRHR